jgi:septum site-determining protein MinC
MAGDKGKAFELEGMVTALSVLRIMTPDLSAIAALLEQKVARSPGLFVSAPVVLDLTAVDGEDEAGAEQAAKAAGRGRSAFRLAPLLSLLKAKGLVPVGVRGAIAERREEATAAGLGLFEARSAPAPEARKAPAGSTNASPTPDDHPAPQAQRTSTSNTTPGPAPSTTSALLLTQPLRSGQIVYAEHRDAVVLAAVNAGAELIADGNIHVYGTLRGRALAGAHGDDQARIFCQRLEADLVSVAGVYLSADELPADKRGKAVQIHLRDGELIVAELAAPAPTSAHP